MIDLYATLEEMNKCMIGLGDSHCLKEIETSVLKFLLLG